MKVCNVAVKKGLLSGPKKMASSPLCAANCSSAMSRSSYVLEVFSSRAWLSFLAASLIPAARFGAISLEISTSQPQLFKYRSTFGLRPLYIFLLAMTSFTEGKMHVIDNQRKKISKVTFMNRDIRLAYLVGFLQHPVVFSYALTTRG